MKQAVLIGAGHAHLHSIRAAGEFARRGHALTVVAPEDFWYSGLATGMLGGLYPPALDRVDIAALAARGGARLITDRMIGLDRAAGAVILERHGPLAYDALSLNLGSAPPKMLESEEVGAYAVKPIRRLCALRAAIESRCKPGAPKLRIVVAGGGSTGAELGANLVRLGRTLGGNLDVVILTGGDRVLKQLPGRAGAWARAHLERRGIRFRTEARVVALEPGRAMLANGEAVPFDMFLNATGLKPPLILAELGLPLGADGGLSVDATLRSPADPRIFGGGDCIALEGHTLARIGVYAIRQAPVLLANLLACLDGTEPQSFRPQRRFLWIMNLGDGTGLGMRGNFWWYGRSAFWLKDRIDRRFLASFGAPDEPTHQPSGGR